MARANLIKFECQHCGVPFWMEASYLRAYRKKFDHDPKYCSSACFGRAKAVAAEAKIEGVCEHCGTPYTRKRKPSGFLVHSRENRRFCSQNCHYAWTREQGQLAHLPGFKRRYSRSDGYVEVREVGERGKPGRWAFEHRVVMERHLRRRLYDHETVHHRSGDRTDNRIENLELFSNRHGQGQRVKDKVAHAVDILELYGVLVKPLTISDAICGLSGLI